VVEVTYEMDLLLPIEGKAHRKLNAKRSFLAIFGINVIYLLDGAGETLSSRNNRVAVVG